MGCARASGNHFASLDCGRAAHRSAPQRTSMSNRAQRAQRDGFAGVVRRFLEGSPGAIPNKSPIIVEEARRGSARVRERLRNAASPQAPALALRIAPAEMDAGRGTRRLRIEIEA